MQQASRILQLSTLALGIAGALAFGQAHASGFQVKHNSAKAAGRAFAGSGVMTGDTAVVVNNPATMSTFDATTVTGDVSVIMPSSSFTGAGTDALGRPLTGGNGGDPAKKSAVPALSIVMPLSGSFDNVTLGAMVSAPFGSHSQYEPGWVGRYHSMTSEVKAIDLTLAASVQPHPQLSLGLGMIVERAEVELGKAVDFGAGICANPATRPLCLNPATASVYGSQRLDGMAVVSGKSTGYGWVAGFRWQATDALAIGLSHRSRIDHMIKGDATFDVPAAARNIFNANPIVAARAIYTNTAGQARLSTPSITTLSASYALNDQFRLAADISRTGWSSFREVRVDFANPVQADSVEPQNWQNSMFYSLGGEFDVAPNLTLRAGVARDETPTQDAYRTPRLPDANRNWLALGLTWRVSDQLEFSGAYTHVKLDRVNINNPPNSSGARLTGSYDTSAHVISLSGQYRF